MSEFKREERYVVLKLKHMDMQDESLLKLSLKNGLSKFQTECVVIESKWPIYEQAWRLVEDLHDGAFNQETTFAEQVTIDSLRRQLETALAIAGSQTEIVIEREKDIKQLQSKIAALSIAVADNDIDEVKRLLPLSGEQVVREIEQAAIESATFYYREPKDNPSLSLSQLHPGKLSFVLENTKTEEWLSVSVEVTRPPDDEKPIQTWEDIENLNNDDVSCVRFSEDEKNGVWLDHEPLRESAYTLNLNQVALKIANDIRVKAAKRLHDLRNPEQEKVSHADYCENVKNSIFMNNISEQEKV